MLMEAKRPVVIIGAAANRQRAVNALRSFVEETGIYWCATQMGKGILDERQRQCLGVTALSSKDFCKNREYRCCWSCCAYNLFKFRSAACHIVLLTNDSAVIGHYAIDFSDVILICGHDESEKPPIIMTPDGKRKVIHVSFSPCNVDNVYSPTLQVVGDVANAVWQIHEKLKANNKQWDMPLMKRYKELTDPLLRNGMDDGAFPMNITRVVSDIRNVLPQDGILSLDNGLYKVVFARLFQAYQPNTVLLDNALATMGAGVPNAIAAKFVFPDRKVVSISGDGGFAMNQPELTTCVQYKLNVVHIVLNDNVS